MFVPSTITKEFTAQFKDQLSQDREFVNGHKANKFEFKINSVDDWPKIVVDMKKYWGSIRGTNLYI